MAKRMTLLAMALGSITALAGEAPPKAEPPPRDINVYDDVGVGDHFPSLVPGSGPYRLPPVERPVPAEAPPVPPPPEAQQQPAVQAPAPAAAVAPAPIPAPAPPVAVAPPPAPVAAPALAPEIERELLTVASNSLLQGRCDTELPRLAELLERTDRAGTRAKALILRARCFTQRGDAEKAKVEYRLFLRDNQGGLWADEARDAVGAR